MIVGSKDKFAIEYEVFSIYKNRTIFAKARIWIEDLYIGCNKHEFIIHHFNDVFMAISESSGNAEKPLIDKILSNESANYVFDHFNTFTDKHYGYMLGDTFDEFFLRIMHDSERVLFLWKLEKLMYCKHENYPENAQLKVIDKNEFRFVVKEYIASLPEGIAP